LKKINFPATLTNIGLFSLYGCNSLTKLVIPATVNKIGNYAFSNCTGLSKLVLPEAVTSISDYTFAGCLKLDTITVSAATTNFGLFAFYGCSALKSINIPTTLKTIKANSFADCISLPEINIPTDVTSIGTYAFANCSANLNVSDANITYSSVDGVLFNKDKSTLIQLPVTKSGYYSIPSTVKIIGAYSFYYCSKLTNISIPASVTTIGEAAFYNCNGLTSLVASSQAPIDITNSESVFFNVDMSKCTLYVPMGTKSTYQASNQWNGFSKIVEIATDVKSVDEIVFSVKCSNNQLQISNVEVGKSIHVFNLSGVEIANVISNDGKTIIDLPSKGIYIVRVDNQSVKISNN
jgi:hypothetical protein